MNCDIPQYRKYRKTKCERFTDTLSKVQVKGIAR